MLPGFLSISSASDSSQSPWWHHWSAILASSLTLNCSGSWSPIRQLLISLCNPAVLNYALFFSAFPLPAPFCLYLLLSSFSLPSHHQIQSAHSVSTTSFSLLWTLSDACGVFFIQIYNKTFSLNHTIEWRCYMCTYGELTLDKFSENWWLGLTGASSCLKPKTVMYQKWYLPFGFARGVSFGSFH